MPSLRHLFPTLLALALAGPTAAAPAGDFELDMQLRFLGLTVGEVVFTADVEPERAVARMDVETAGMVKRLTGFRSAVRSDARLDGTGDAWPVAFDSYYETKRETRNVTLRFDGERRVVELATLKRGEPTAVDVPSELQHGTMDPLAALFTIRNWLAEVRAAGSGARTLELFDGRRRYDLDVTYLARRPADFDDGASVLELRLDVRPIAGFNDDDPRGGARQLFVLVSDDDLLVPLVIRTATREGLDAVVRTTRVCAGPGRTACREIPF